MNLFSYLGNWVMGGLRRLIGTQYSTPSYGEEAASPVTFDSAMQLSAVWACVKLLAETVSSLPLSVYKIGANGRKIAESHALSILFSGKVNKYQTKVEFFETVILNLIMHGNAYCVIQRIGDRIIGLLPIMSAQVTTVLLNDGTVTHQYTHDAGVTVYADENIWHLKLMGNGVIGLSPLAYQRNTLGIAQAAESAVTKIYKNGAKPSGVLSIDRILTKEQRQQVRDSFTTLTVSTDDRLMVLEAGMKFQAISLSPQDIELLNSRKFQISEICRWYGVPSVMVNDNNGTSTWGSGIAQIMEGFYKITLRPLLEKIESSIHANLLSPTEQQRMEVEFDFDALLRGDSKTRYEGYQKAISGGVLTPNEARMKENLAPMEGGDKLFIQGAMMPIDKIGQTPAPAPAPAPAPDPANEPNGNQE
ncbi:MAG: phage portal protein [Rhodoferax sp.]|nr:phage portal protein [Rhodoferax sp.]